MDKVMDNSNLWHLRNQIFEDLSHEDVLNCRRVCKFWNESLRRMSDVKFIKEFCDRDLEYTNEKISTFFPGWKNAAQKYGFQASMDDIEKVKDSLKKLARGKGKCSSIPVHEAARNGDVKLLEFILRTSFDMNTKVNVGKTALHWACAIGQVETVQLFIQNSKEFGIDLNVKDDDGMTALHEACKYDKTETAQLIMQNSKEFGINLNAKNNEGNTALHWACEYGKTEIGQLIIQNSKIFGIDLNTKNNHGSTALHVACWNGHTETIQMILKNWKEFGIDIKAQDNDGKTALDLINEELDEELDEESDEDCFREYVEIRKVLETEYSHIDVKRKIDNMNEDREDMKAKLRKMKEMVEEKL